MLQEMMEVRFEITEEVCVQVYPDELTTDVDHTASSKNYIARKPKRKKKGKCTLFEAKVIGRAMFDAM